MADLTKNVLALDTAMGGCSVAVVAGEREALRQHKMSRGQAEVLMPMICEVMEEVGLEFQDIEMIVTTLGPGAFTGLRIGLSVAKSLGLALNVPVCGISSLQALAYDCALKHNVEGRLRVLIESKRDDFYVQDFDSAGQAVSDARALAFSDIISDIDTQDVLLGDAVGRFEELAGGELSCKVLQGLSSPDPLNMARGMLEGRSGYSETVVPIYLRGADVSQSKKQYRSLSSS